MRYYSNVKTTTVYSLIHPNVIAFLSGLAPNGNDYGEYDTTVSLGTVYVVGDNTPPGVSYDSDEWGLVPTSDIVGLVVKRITPSARNF
jgi:hypothetical protein